MGRNQLTIRGPEEFFDLIEKMRGSTPASRFIVEAAGRDLGLTADLRSPGRPRSPSKPPADSVVDPTPPWTKQQEVPEDAAERKALLETFVLYDYWRWADVRDPAQLARAVRCWETESRDDHPDPIPSTVNAIVGESQQSGFTLNNRELSLKELWAHVDSLAHSPAIPAETPASGLLPDPFEGTTS